MRRTAAARSSACGEAWPAVNVASVETLKNDASIKMEIPSEKKRKMLVLLECVHLLIFGGGLAENPQKLTIE